MNTKISLDYLFTYLIFISSIPSFSLAQHEIKRTPWGKPALNGYWDYHHLTPLQRPAEFEGIEYMDETQAKDWEDNAFNREAERRGRTNPGVNYVGVDLWHEEALDEWETDDHRTALITDPPNGRLPAMLKTRREELANRQRYLNARDTLTRILDMGVVPIINENDTVTVTDAFISGPSATSNSSIMNLDSAIELQEKYIKLGYDKVS